MENKEIIAQCLDAARKVKQNSPMYRKLFADIDIDKMKTKSDFEQLPFTDKNDLRDAYPLNAMSAKMEDVVRVHSSSGTTGMPIIMPYTKQDIADWAEMFARCYEIAGITKHDVVQITPGFGLWTAGLGFLGGAEKIGALSIPTGAGQTEKQLQMMRDLGTTVLCCTSSYALLLSEEVDKRNLRSEIKLKKGIFGSECWGDKIRERIYQSLGIEFYDIYGLTEIYGPGIGIDCAEHDGMHLFDDFIYFEIIDPKTGKVLPEGEEGELVCTTYRREGEPLIRYRTHDLTRFIPGRCKCGLPYPRIDRIKGRSDDMFKIKGTNIFPVQVENVMKQIEGLSSEYRIILKNIDLRDKMIVQMEMKDGYDAGTLAREFVKRCKASIGIIAEPEIVCIGTLPRSEKKTKRVVEERY